MNRTARHLTFGNVVACLALFIALGGVSYAAIKLPAGSVGTKQLRSKAVTIQKISPAARAALATTPTTAGAKGDPGPAGQPGPKGDSGAPGKDGAPGTARAFAFVSPNCNLPALGCPISKAKNVVSARRPAIGVYCITVAPGIDAATSGSAAGIDYRRSEFPEGAMSAMADSTNEACLSGELEINTTELQLANNQLNPAFTNGAAFWVLVP